MLIPQIRSGIRRSFLVSERGHLIPFRSFFSLTKALRHPHLSSPWEEGEPEPFCLGRERTGTQSFTSTSPTDVLVSHVKK